MSAFNLGALIALLNMVLTIVTDALNEVDKAEKEYAKKRQELLAALASGDADALNKLINEL